MDTGKENYFIRKQLVELSADSAQVKPVTALMTKLSHVLIKGDYHHPRHTHDFCELILPSKHDYRCLLNGESMTVSPGELLWVQPPDIHEDFYDVGGELTFLIYQLTDYSGEIWPHGIFAPDSPANLRIIKMRRNSSLRNMLRILEDSRGDDFCSDTIREKTAEAFFWQAVSEIDPEFLSPQFKSGMNQNVFQQQVEKYFQKIINKQLDVKEIAAHFQMSRRSFEYKFNSAFGVSPLKAFNACKMRLARQFLEQGQSVADVAEQLGFSDPFYFSTVFKRITGLAPSRV